MKSRLIRDQHLYLKSAIFLFGIIGTFEISLRQLAFQSLLFILFLAAEARLYLVAISAFRKLLPFFAAYWLLATLFKVDFIASILFCTKIIHLVLITVAAWGSADKNALLAQSKLCRKSRLGKRLISFILATYFFLQEYLSSFKELPKSQKPAEILERAIAAGKSVHDESHMIAQRVQELLTRDVFATSYLSAANLAGVLFLCLLGLAHSL